MQILIISGSPRRQGNSDLLCDEFARGAREKGHSVEKINLQEKEIRSCLACYACFQTGACVQSDDMADVLAKICAAQVLVLASPTYFLTMSGQLKVMIDRLLPKWQDLGGKDVYIIVTGHDGKSGLLRVGDDLAASAPMYARLSTATMSGKREKSWVHRPWRKPTQQGSVSVIHRRMAEKIFCNAVLSFQTGPLF